MSHLRLARLNVSERRLKPFSIRAFRHNPYYHGRIAGRTILAGPTPVKREFSGFTKSRKRLCRKGKYADSSGFFRRGRGFFGPRGACKTRPDHAQDTPGRPRMRSWQG